jgi:hypothetical protein
MTSTGQGTMKERRLSHSVALNLCQVSAGEDLEITARKKFGKNLFVALAAKGSDARGEGLKLLGCIYRNDSYYCIIGQPSSFDEDQIVTYLMVMKVIDKNTLRTISEAELKSIEEACRHGLETMPRLQEEDIEPILGDFPRLKI